MRERVPSGRQTSAAETAWAPCGGKASACLGVPRPERSQRPQGPDPYAARLPPAAAAPRPLAAAPPEVETRASHDAPRGPYSNCAEKREEVVMAAPGPEVLCPAAVPGKAWGPQLREPWGPVSFLTAANQSFSPRPFLWPVFLALICRRSSWLPLHRPLGPGSHWFVPTLSPSPRRSAPRLITATVN